MKRFVFFLIVSLGVFTSFSAVLAVNLGFGEFYKDVKDPRPYAYQIDWLADNGVVRGYGDGNFYPEKCVNRAEFLKMMYKMLETDVADLAAGAGWNGYFSDVDMNTWYWPYLRFALQQGAVQGYPDKTFRPDSCVNRVEAVKMAVLGFHNGNVPKARGALNELLVDVSTDAWYSPMIQYAHDANVLGLAHIVRKDPPRPDSDFGGSFLYLPASGMTRGEVAYLLFMLKALKDNEVEAHDSALWSDGKKNVLYNDERGVLMPKQLSVAYRFDGCGKANGYATSNWWSSLQSVALKSVVDLSTVVDMCYSKEGGVVVFMTESKEDLKKGYALSKVKLHKYKIGALEFETLTGEEPYVIFGESNSVVSDFEHEAMLSGGQQSQGVEFGKRVGDFIIIEPPESGAYYEYYFGKNILKGSFKAITIID